MMNLYDDASLFEAAPLMDFWKPARLMTTHFSSSSSSLDVLKTKTFETALTIPNVILYKYNR